MPPLPLVHAFGLALSPEEWTKKSFCQVSANEIRERIRKGMSPPDAITTKPDRPGLTRFRGVSFHKNNKKWVAQIKINGKVEFLGNFSSDVDAAEAFDKKARGLGRQCNFHG